MHGYSLVRTGMHLVMHQDEHQHTQSDVAMDHAVRPSHSGSTFETCIYSRWASTEYSRKQYSTINCHTEGEYHIEIQYTSNAVCSAACASVSGEPAHSLSVSHLISFVLHLGFRTILIANLASTMLTRTRTPLAVRPSPSSSSFSSSSSNSSSSTLVRWFSYLLEVLLRFLLFRIFDEQSLHPGLGPHFRLCPSRP